MKHTLIVFLLLLIAVTAVSQPKTRGRVKRKYRNVEQGNETLPQVVFRGMVRDAARIPIQGASVETEGLKRLVHSNEFGQFMLGDLPAERLRIRVSCLGYRTKTIDYMLQAGYNDHYIALDREPVYLETVIATAQNREQHIPDIPAAVSVVTHHFAEQLGVTDFSDITGFITEVHFENPVTGNAAFSIQGTTGGFGFPEVSPSVAVYSDQVPALHQGGFSTELFDMERLEILKGPQNTLFGRNALNGAIHFISKKPGNDFGGYVTAGAGNYWNKEVQAAVNYPVVKDMLFLRAAGLFHDRSGYVENTFGGTLNGKNVKGGRFSVRFLPAWNHKIDLQLNYQKNDEPGIAFINSWIPGEEGKTGLFNNNASLNRGEELGSEKQLMDAALTYRFFRDEHNYWTSVSSYRLNNTSAHWDADGTSVPALEMDNKSNSELFFQEIRFNFVRRSLSIGSIGVNYLQEEGNYSQALSSNDELIFGLLSAPGSFVMPGQSRLPFHLQPPGPAPAKDSLSTGNHHEDIFNERMIQSAQAFLHFTYQLKQRLFFSFGARAVYDRMQLIHESVYSGGEESVLGQFSGAAPNLLFKPLELQQITKNSLSFTGQAGLTYRRNENFSLFLNAVRGRRPHVLQFTWDGRPLITASEKVYSAETGWKATIKKRIFWNVNGFYRLHMNVQTLQWAGTEGTGLLAANGKATSNGATTGLRVALIQGVDLFGNYAWMQSVFDSTGVDNKSFLYAGNSFALSPEHSFSAGFTTKVNIVRALRFFVTPWYFRKSHFWFTEANTPGLEQPAFGLLNIHFGLEMDDPGVVLSVYGTNLLEEKYISGAGHWGGQFGLPTFVPGSPRLVGVRVTWNF